VPGIRHPLMINGVPVVTAPEEIDITTAEQLRAVLLCAAARGHATVVVDMARTRFCDSAGLTVLVRAHKQAVSEGDGLRLVITPGGVVARIFAITRLDLVFPMFTCLDEALARGPAAVIRPSRPRPTAGRPRPRQPGLPGRRGVSW
jgi:anti-sigma B factor antagonist